MSEAVTPEVVTVKPPAALTTLDAVLIGIAVWLVLTATTYFTLAHFDLLPNQKAAAPRVVTLDSASLVKARYESLGSLGLSGDALVADSTAFANELDTYIRSLAQQNLIVINKRAVFAIPASGDITEEAARVLKITYKSERSGAAPIPAPRETKP